MRRFLSFRFLAVLILSLVLLIFQSSMQIENGLSSNTLSKLPSDVKMELTRCLQGLSRGWDQQLVDIANGILMNESYSAEAWNDFFLEYFETNPFNNRLEEYLGYPLFLWHHETHKQLQEGIYPALMRNVERLSFDPELLLVEEKIETYKNSLEYLRRISSDDLGDVGQTTKLEILDWIKIKTKDTLDFLLANITLDLQFDPEISFAKISGLNQLLKIFCNIEQQIQDPTFFNEEALYLFAKRIIEENKQIFNQDFIYDKNTQAKASLLREQIKLYLVGFLDIIDPKKDEISHLLSLKGKRELIWRELTILTLDNNKFSDYQLNSLYQLMKAIPEELRIVRSISLLHYVGNVPGFDLYSKLPRFNTVEWEGVTYYEYNPRGSEDFTMATAHEWGHQLDAHYISRNRALSERRDQLIRQAGYEQLNYIRSEAEFLQKNPQEFIASICNAYFANTRWVFDLGLERLKMGFKEPLNQFLFFAEIFSLGRNTTPFFLIDRYGNVSVTQVQIYRDDNRRINSLVIAQTLYKFTLDSEGNVLSYSVIDLQTDKNPPYTTHNYDELWHTSDFIITLTAIDNESRVAETYYRINNGPIMAVSVDGYPIITTENANNILEYWSVDVAGNEEPHKILTGIKLDKTAPSTSISFDGINGENNWFISSVTATLTASDSLSGIDSIFYSLNNIKWERYEGPIIITNEGVVNVYFKSMDRAGNIELTKMESIKIDRTPPTGSITINNNATYTNSTLVVLHLTAMDNASGIAKACFSNDGVWDTEPWEDYMTIKTWTLPTGDGVKTVYVQFMDKAGLISTTYYDIIILDTSVPSIIEVKRCPGGDIRPGEPVKILVNAADSLSGIRDIILSYNVGDSPAWNDVPMTLNVTSGLYEAIIQVQQVNTTVKYKITVYDNAGNYVIEDNNGQYHVYAVKVPAKFRVTELSMSAVEVKPGEAVTITVKVTNVGGETGSYTVELKIDGVAVDFKTVTLAGGEFKTVTFEVTRYAMGTYDVEVDGQKGTFTVKEVAVPSSSPLIESWLLYIGAAIITITILAIMALLIKKKRSS